MISKVNPSEPDRKYLLDWQATSNGDTMKKDATLGDSAIDITHSMRQMSTV